MLASRVIEDGPLSLELQIPTSAVVGPCGIGTLSRNKTCLRGIINSFEPHIFRMDGARTDDTNPPRSRGLSRRSVAKVSGAVAGGLAVALGFLTGAVDVDIRESPEDRFAAVKADVSDGMVSLPRPQTAEGDTRVATAIAKRRSRREYADEPIPLAELGQLLWAAQGVTQRKVGTVDFRAAPSAGATYPLEVFVVPDEPGIEDVEPGVFHYRQDDHQLERVRSGSFGSRLQWIAIDQEWVGEAAMNIVITSIDERTTERYGVRGRRRYVPMEAGHVGQNIYLQAESLGLSTVAIGAFRDDALRSLLDIGEDHRPLYIYPVGKRA